MLTRPGSKLLDFGLAKLRRRPGRSRCRSMTQARNAAPATGARADSRHRAVHGARAGRGQGGRRPERHLGAWRRDLRDGHGTRPFHGDTPASVIGAILKDEPPPISARQPLARAHSIISSRPVSPRNPTSAGSPRRTSATSSPGSPGNARRHHQNRCRARRRPVIAGWVVAAVLLVALGVALTVGLPRPGADISARACCVQRLPAAGRVFAATSASVPVPQLAVSPDGRHLVFVAAEPQGPSFLWLRPLGESEARRLPGTDAVDAPFWSPDSRTVAFFSQGL